MNNNVVEKTLKSIDNIDRLSDLAAISIYNTSHEAIDKFDVMQEHATPEYVEGEFVQESLLTGVLIGAGIIGVAISAFLIIKKILESKAKGDPNAASNTVAGVNLLNPDEINKLFDGWNDKYFKNHPDLVVEDVPGADVSELGRYNGILLEAIRGFCDSANSIIDGVNTLTDEEMRKAIDELNKEFDSNINMDELVSKTGRVDKNTILQIKAGAEGISKTLREFDAQVTKCITEFRNKEKNNQNAGSDNEENKISEENIKLLEKALKAKANTAGAIMDNFRNKCLNGIAQALDAKVKEAEGQAKAKQQQELTPLTDDDKQTIIKSCVNLIKDGYEYSDEAISHYVKTRHIASPEEIQEIIDAVRAETNGSSKESTGGPESGHTPSQDDEPTNSETDESSDETETSEGTPTAEPATTGESEEEFDDDSSDDSDRAHIELNEDMKPIIVKACKDQGVPDNYANQYADIIIKNHDLNALRQHLNAGHTGEHKDENDARTEELIKAIFDALYDSLSDTDSKTPEETPENENTVENQNAETSTKTNETSNAKLFTDEEEDKMADAAYAAVTGLKSNFRKEIYNAVTNDGFAEAAKKLYAKYANDANKLKQINETLIAMAKSIGKESEVPALSTTEATPTDSETPTENQTPEQTENAEKKEETPSTEETTGTPETPKEEEQSETSSEESNGNDIKRISDSTGLDEVKVENIYKILKDNSTPDDVKRAFIIDAIGPMIHMPGFNQKMANDSFKINYDNFKKVAEAANVPFEIEQPEISEKDINNIHTIISGADTEETKLTKIADNLMNSTSEPEDEILNTADTIENTNQDQNKPPTQITSDDLIAAKNANIDEEIAERIAYAINNNKDITSGVVVPAMGTLLNDINERSLNLFEQSQYLKTYNALVKAFNYFHLDPNQYLDPEKYPDPKSLGILSDEERAEQDRRNKWLVDLADKLFDYLSDNKTIAEFISDKKISEQDVADALNHIGMGDISVPIDENKVRRDMGISELKTQTAPKAQPSSPSNSSTGSRAGSNRQPTVPKQGAGQPARKPVNKPKSGAKQQPANKPGIIGKLGQFLGF